VPWYVSAFLRLVNPFIDPVTKSKIKPNEPLPNHVPVSQLMNVSGGEVDFKYDHSVYWPALEKITTERRQQRKERWEKGGKLIGESEIYLWGGEEGSIGAAKEAAAVTGDVKVPVSTNADVPAVEASNGNTKEDVALANGVEQLNVNDIKEAEKPLKEAVPTAA
jgi:hypothetical protein